MSAERFAVRINYKSGLSVDVTVASLTVKRTVVNGALSLEWEDMIPRPYTVGIDEIESVWDLGPVGRKVKR